MFDDAIEVAITTYLSLHPIQRGNRQYSRDDTEKWNRNYHAKLDFLDVELGKRGLSWTTERASIVFVHDCRGDQYHGGTRGTPETRVIALAREAATLDLLPPVRRR